MRRIASKNTMDRMINKLVVLSDWVRIMARAAVNTIFKRRLIDVIITGHIYYGHTINLCVKHFLNCSFLMSTYKKLHLASVAL